MLLMRLGGGIQCDKPTCHRTRFVEDGEPPAGFTVHISYVAKPDANGPQPVAITAFACQKTHITAALMEALRREGL